MNHEEPSDVRLVHISARPARRPTDAGSGAAAELGLATDVLDARTLLQRRIHAHGTHRSLHTNHRRGPPTTRGSSAPRAGRERGAALTVPREPDHRQPKLSGMSRRHQHTHCTHPQPSCTLHGALRAHPAVLHAAHPVRQSVRSRHGAIHSRVLLHPEHGQSGRHAVLFHRAARISLQFSRSATRMDCGLTSTPAQTPWTAHCTPSH
ncbi:hypothetical protein B566_EDAN008589, partial [Ephemera danica]